MFLALQQKSSPSVLLWQYIYLRLLCSYSLWIFIIFLQTFFKFIKSNSTCRKIHFHTKLWCCNFITKILAIQRTLCSIASLSKIRWEFLAFAFIYLYFCTSMSLTRLLFSFRFIEVSSSPFLVLLFFYVSFSLNFCEH